MPKSGVGRYEIWHYYYYGEGGGNCIIHIMSYYIITYKKGIGMISGFELAVLQSSHFGW